MGICFVLTGAGELLTLAHMETDLYRRPVARRCAVMDNVFAVSSAPKQRLKLSILLALAFAFFPGGILADWTAEDQRNLAAIQAAIEVYNSPKMTTNDFVRLLEMKGRFTDSKALREYIAVRAYENPHLSFSMTAADIGRLKRAGATPELIAAMKSPASVAHPAKVLTAPGSNANVNSMQLAANKSAAAAESSSAGSANIELILDASGSMAAKIQGRSKMDIAKQALTELLLGIPSSSNVAVRAYGHRKKDDCADIELIGSFGEARSSIPAKVNALKPLGKTPLSNSIAAAAKDFLGKEGQENTVILITDGEETCNADPCAAAKLAHESGVKVKINVIGFKIEAKERAQLECIANAGGGKYVSANDAAELTAATKQVAQVEATPPPPPPTVAPTPTPTPPDDNILAQANGGQLLVAPDDSWQAINDGKEEDCGTVTVPGEAVYAFKDEQPATFDKISILVPDASGSNLKEFELLVGDNSPTGTFRSIGTFTAQNAKMLKSPFQEFKFQPVTAKYLKIKLISNYNMSLTYKTRVCEFKVHGKMSEKAAAQEGATSAADKPAATNILAQANGGQVLAAPDDSWQATNDGKEEECGTVTVPGEAVYAFKDEQPATFDTFSILIPDASGSNPKEFELLVADDSPTGTFRSIGTFTAQNAKMLKSPYQEFKFQSVTGKYLKVKLVSNYNMSLTYKTRVCEFKVYNSGK